MVRMNTASIWSWRASLRSNSGQQQVRLEAGGGEIVELGAEIPLALVERDERAGCPRGAPAAGQRRRAPREVFAQPRAQFVAALRFAPQMEPSA
jgi:hypothetical protein